MQNICLYIHIHITESNSKQFPCREMKNEIYYEFLNVSILFSRLPSSSPVPIQMFW